MKSLAARGACPHGVTFSRSAEICPYGKPLKKPNCKIVAKSVPLNATGCFFFPTWAHFLSRVAEGEGERGRAHSFQVLSLWPGDPWHPSALGLALGSSEQVEQDGCLCRVQDTFCHKDETQEVCNLPLGITSAWVHGSELLR